MHSHAIASLTTAELRGRQVGYEDNPNGLWVLKGSIYVIIVHRAVEFAEKYEILENHSGPETP